MTRMMRYVRWTVLTLGLTLSLPAAAFAQTVVSCPFGLLGDLTDRGFYVPNFTGSSLSTVQLRYGVTPGSSYTVTLTARTGAFNGALIGTAQQAFTIGAGGQSDVTFDFANAPVTPGSVVTFAQTVTVGNAGSLVYDVGVGPCTNITQTNGTTPPLDSVRRATVGAIITAGAGVPTMAEWLKWTLAALLIGGIGYQLQRRRLA